MATDMSAIQVPLITASGTIVAAVITGFLAAMLKHRWDKQEDAESWHREREERRREELKIALVEFFRLCRQGEEIGNRLWRQNTRKHRAAEVRRQTKAGERPTRDGDESSRTQDIDESWFSKLAEGAAAADLLIVLLGIDDAEPFRRYMIDLRTWIKDMMDRGDRGDEFTAAPPTKYLKSIAYEILSRA
jgi:hypothetical protein